MTEASAGSGGSRDLIMLQMLAPTSDIVFLNTSPQAPVEIANSAEAAQTYADKRQQGHERQRSCCSKLTCNRCHSTSEKGGCTGEVPPEHFRFDRLETEKQERPCRQDREDH